MEAPILEMKNISKSFNGIRVLHEVCFELRQGEVHALMGGNGAGKSTLMKILTGVHTPDSGSIRLSGAEVQFRTPLDSEKHGISMIFQEFSLVPAFTVAQNIFLGREPRTRLGFIDDRKCADMTRELLAELRVDLDPNRPVAELGVGYWQMTEIAKALSKNAKILVMDEPTSSLTAKETEVLFDLIARLKEKGISVIYISHRMEEIYRICDRITVMGDGRHLVTDDAERLDLDTVIRHIAGKNIDSFEWKPRAGMSDPPVVLQVSGLKSDNRVRGVDLELRQGEVLGIAGLMGSGRSELLRALFGIDRVTAGEIRLRGQKVTIRNPREAIRLGLALVPEDRRVQGLVLEHEVKNNILLPSLARKRDFFVNDRSERSLAETWVRNLDIKTDSIRKLVGLLSGGNQQKIVFAKWLANDPDILLLDEPTIGIDIRAKSEIIETIRQLANEGKSIVLVSSEMAELLAVSDRIVVMHNGVSKKVIARENIASEGDLQHAIQGL